MRADRFILFTAAATFIGCVPSTDTLDEPACTADLECPTGQMCVDGACAGPERGPVIHDRPEAHYDRPDPIGCLEARPSRLDFRRTRVGRQEMQPLSLVNCGDIPVQLGSLEFGDAAFSTTGDVDGFLSPGTTRTVDVRFSPQVGGRIASALSIESSAPALSVPLTAEGEDRNCPEVVVEARTSSSKEWKSGVETTPLNSVAFRARTLTDEPVHVEWSLARRPTGSTARLLQAPRSEEPGLFMDLAGDYAVQVMAMNEEGTCGRSDVLELHATPDEEIHIELVWDTPLDDDQTDDDGADLDLHFLHPDGHWNKAPHDIFWDNPTADWGADGVDDDPSLDMDDTDGAGPENVTLSGAEHGLTYAIGVYYYDTNGFGSSDATVRLFLDGYQAFESSRKLPQRGAFWSAATIDWPSRGVFAVDEVTHGFPNPSPKARTTPAPVNR